MPSSPSIITEPSEHAVGAPSLVAGAPREGRERVSRLDPGRLVRGRLGVLGFHARTLPCLAVILVGGSIVRRILVSSRGLGRIGLDPVSTAIGWTIVGAAVIALVVILVNSIRRLHDLGRGGWWVVLLAVPIVNIFLQLYLWFMPGRAEANRFGEPARPAAFERAIGRVGLGVLALLMLEQAWRLERIDIEPDTLTLAQRASAEAARAIERRSVASGAYAATMRRFAEAEPRAMPIADEAAFRRLIVGRVLAFVGEHVDAPMVFDEDGTLHGTFTQSGGEHDDAALSWSWRDGALCREGRIARSRIPRACGTASLVPDVGLLVEYPHGSPGGEERWVMY